MYRILTVFGIRPDFIRASVLLKKMQKHPKIKLDFAYTGQHYDEELKGVFFKELNIPEPTFVLDTAAPTHPQQHAKLISQLEEVINLCKPDCVIFLGDANAVIGCITPLKMGIPIIHIEGGMRSYDWRMPEERNRVLIDHVSDVIYVYQEDYKYRLIQEGICPTKIEVVGNTIVDVLREYCQEPVFVKKFMIYSHKTENLLDKYGVKRKEFALVTIHRDEHMKDRAKTISILNEIHKWCIHKGIKAILPIMPRLGKIIEKFKYQYPYFIFTKPLGFFDFVRLEKNALIEFTDSGTNQEVSAILGTPCVVVRNSTERPETFMSNITLMTHNNICNAANDVIERKRNRGFSLGDGNAAQKILDDLLEKLEIGWFKYNDPSPIDNFKQYNMFTWDV